MALPKITNNSPVTGSIAWTATNLTFGTTNFSVPAGSSSKKFVWWEYRAGAPALVDGDVLPELAPEDVLLFLNKNGVGALVPMTDVVDGSLIVSGSVMAAAIAADQIQTYHINADAVTATEIAAGAISAEHISAGTITTDKLGVGSVGDNLVTNGSFEEFSNGMPIGWRAVQLGNGGAVDIVTGVSSSGANAARLVATSSSSNARMEQTPDRFIPVTAAAGRKWYVSMRAGAGTAITSGVYFRASWYDASKVLISSNDVVSNGAMGTTFNVYEGQVTPPSTARYMSLSVYLYLPNVATNLYVDELTAREVVISAQIGDGSITTAKLVANAVTANQIAAGAVTASKLLVGDFENLASINELHGITVTSFGQTQIVGGYNSLVTDSGSFFMVKEQAGPVPFKNGEELYYSFTAKATAATTAQFGVWIYNAAGSNKAATTSTFSIGTTDTAISGTITVPTADATFGPAKQWVTGLSGVSNKGIQIKDVVVRRRNGGELLVDGSIVASKIATNAVSADKIAANAVTADKILAGVIGTNHMVANSINADRLVANSITADKLKADAIDGKTITGATIQTAQPNTGFRIALDSSGLKGWDANNVNFLKADAAGLSVTGTLSAVGNGVDYSVFNNGQYGTRPVEVSIGGAVGRVGAQTEQWPPLPPSKPVPGFSFKPTNVSMYEQASITAYDGQFMSLQSGITTAEYDTWKSDLNNAGQQLLPTRMSLHRDGASFTKSVSAEKYLLGGQDMSAGEVHVFDSSGTIGNKTVPVPRLTGLLATNAELSTASQMAYAQSGDPGTLRVYKAGIYDITFSYSQDGGVTGARNFLEIKKEGDTIPVARVSFNPQEDSATAVATGVRLAAADKLSFEVYQDSGSSKTYRARVRMKRVAAPVPVKAWEEGNQNLQGNLTVSGPITGKHSRWEGTTTNWWVEGGQPWDSGPVTMDSGTTRTTAPSMCSPGPFNGSVTFNETGFYSVSVMMIPRIGPGTGWTALNASWGEKIAQTGNSSAMWETYLSTPPIHVGAGSYLRTSCAYSAGHYVDVRWRIVKVAV